MFSASRRAVVIAASFALGLSWLAPAAMASRPGDDTGNGEESTGLLDLLDLPGLLGSLPLVGDTVQQLGLPLDGLGLDGLPTVEGIGLPALDSLGLPGLDGLGLDALPLGGGFGELGEPLPIGNPLGVLDGISAGGLDLSVLVDLSVSGGVNLL